MQIKKKRVTMHLDKARQSRAGLRTVQALVVMSIFGHWFNPAQASGQEQPNTVWSDSEQGLKIGLVIKNRSENKLELGLCFANDGKATKRIYFLKNAFFRSFQSQFMVTDVKGEVRPLTQPSPGHGYIVGEKDFPLIQPESTVCFEQSLLLPASPQYQPTRLIWVYQNRIERWQGEVETFDGPTRHLFDESDHPDLWTGETQVTVSIR